MDGCMDEICQFYLLSDIVDLDMCVYTAVWVTKLTSETSRYLKVPESSSCYSFCV